MKMEIEIEEVEPQAKGCLQPLKARRVTGTFSPRVSKRS